MFFFIQKIGRLTKVTTDMRMTTEDGNIAGHIRSGRDHTEVDKPTERLIIVQTQSKMVGTHDQHTVDALMKYYGYCVAI